MVTETITVSDPRILAEFIKQDRFKGIFEKRIGVPPDHMALLMRNGEFVDAYIGAHFSAGGIIHRMRGIVGGSHQISLLIADLKTFQLKMPLRATSADNVEIVGTASIDLQINPEKPQNIIGIMQARKFLLKSDILERIKSHISDRVVEAAVGRMKADELRGNIGLQDKIQADLITEVERVVGDLGVLIRAVSVEWAVNEIEREAMDRAVAERQQEQMDYRLATIKRELARTMESETIQIQANVDLAKLQGASEAEIAKMVLDNELSFVDARETGQRVQELKALQHEIEVLERERAVQMKNALEDADHVVNLTERQAKLSALERDIKKLDVELKIQLESAEAMAKIAIQKAQDAAAVAKIAALQEVELKGFAEETVIKDNSANNQTQREINVINANAAVKQGELGIYAGMSPEQILAVSAGLSPAVAAVLAEQAKASGQGNAQTMAIMQQMVDQANRAHVQSEQQARAMFEMGMKGAVGVSHGAGGKSAGAASAAMGEEPPKAAGSECPKCHHVNALDIRFCRNCGTQLRTN